MAKRRTPSGDEDARRGFPENAGEAVARAALPALKRFGFETARLITDWPRIVGDALAQVTQPLRLTRTPHEGTTLSVAVDGAAAVVLQHQTPQILSRVNAYLGPPGVQRLKLVQARVRRPAPPAPPPERPVAPEAQARISRAAEGIGDNALRERLVALGRRIHLRNS